MALSNWDTFALDEASRPVRGAVDNHKGVLLQIYKNWLYISDRKAKSRMGARSDANDHYGYRDDVVAEFHSGTLKYAGWQIYAERGPKAGIYVVAASYEFRETSEVDEAGKHVWGTDRQSVLIGCGVYGYRSDLEVYRAEMEAEGTDVDDLIAAIERDDAGYTVGWSDGQVEIIQTLPTDTGEFTLHTVYTGPEKPSEYVGVEASDVAHLVGVIERSRNHMWVPTDATAPWQVDLSKGLRFNPGDGFFHDSAGATLSATPPGQAGPPLLQQMLNGSDD